MNRISIKFFKDGMSNILVWLIFGSITFLIYELLSSHDFSFLLTLSSLIKCFGLCLLFYKSINSNSVRGLSVKTIELYFIVYLTRFLSIIKHQGYLPFDQTGDWFYHCVEFLSLSIVTMILYLIFYSLNTTYEESFDRFGNFLIPNELGILYLLLPSITLAFMFHP